MKMMNNKYPLEWLDSLVLQHFNPAKTDFTAFAEGDLAAISKNAALESARIQVRIKNEIFALKRKRQIRLLVRKYHSTLIFLMDNMLDSCKADCFRMPLFSSAGDAVMKSLDELLCFLESRYAAYLSLDEKVPISYLLVSRKEMKLKLKNIVNPRLHDSRDHEVLKLISDELTAALLLEKRSRTTFRQVLYLRKVLQELEDLKSLDFGDEFFTSLDCKLIGLNFNSRDYMSLLLKKLDKKIETADLGSQKLTLLSYCFKEFRQIPVNERLFLNGDVQPLRIVVENWFQSEMEYQQKLMELLPADTELNNDQKQQNKLECDLSADQIGIILRAADEARVVKSRSMSLVFQRIVPHLSTAFKRDLSYHSVRSKSYNAEENDKNIAILTLEKMIKKIRSY